MRILGYVPHPYLKITFFKDSFSHQLKIQHEVYELILSYRDGEINDEQAFLRSMTNSEFIRAIEKKIYEIHQLRMAQLKTE